MGEKSMDLGWTRCDGAVVGAAADVCGWHEGSVPFKSAIWYWAEVSAFLVSAFVMPLDTKLVKE